MGRCRSEVEGRAESCCHGLRLGRYRRQELDDLLVRTVDVFIDDPVTLGGDAVQPLPLAAEPLEDDVGAS